MGSKFKALMDRHDLTFEQKLAIFDAFDEFAQVEYKRNRIVFVTLMLLGGCALGIAIARS